MHFGFWLNNDYKADPIGTAKKLAPILKAAKMTTLMEVGFPGKTSKPDFAANMGELAAKDFVAKIKRLEAEGGIRVDEVECELRLYIFQILADRFPDWSAADLFQQITGQPLDGEKSTKADRAYWPDFIKTTREGLGDRPINVGCPPIYLPWKGLYTAGKDLTFKHPADGREMKFDGPTFWHAMLNDQTSGFLCDSPWYLMNHKVYVERGYLKKLIDVERFIHARGKRFNFIVNNGQKKELPPEQWDKQYADDSMNALVTFQLNGGRADRYVLESWYDGPFSIVPDDQPNTFTYLVRRAILFLKGPGQKLSLKVEGSKVTLTNEGEVACLPAVRMASGGSLRVSFNNVDVTKAFKIPEGFVPSALVESGQSIVFEVAGSGTIEVLWNPQDPSKMPRALVKVR